MPGNQCLGTGTKWCCVDTLSTRYVTSGDPGEGPGPPPLFSEQTEARRGDIKIFGDRAGTEGPGTHFCARILARVLEKRVC